MRLPGLAQTLGEIRLRFDQNAGPPRPFELPRLRAALRVMGANLDKKAVARATEKFRLELFLGLRGKHYSHC